MKEFLFPYFILIINNPFTKIKNAMTVLETIQSDIKNWWLFILKGLVFFGAGIYVFCSPLAGYLGLSVMFSVVIIISGISQIFFASVNSRMKGWGWTLTSGNLDLIIGFYLF